MGEVMTRKNFEMIAEMLKEARDDGVYRGPKAYGRECGRWADRLAHENPRFNRYTFLVACGVL